MSSNQMVVRTHADNQQQQQQQQQQQYEKSWAKQNNKLTQRLARFFPPSSFVNLLPGIRSNEPT